jgi:hypothetical protein
MGAENRLSLPKSNENRSHSPAGRCSTSGPSAFAEGWDGLLPHLMEWMAGQRLNGDAGNDTPGAFDA